MKINVLLLLFLLPFFAAGQKKKLTIKQAVVGLYTDLKVTDLSQLQFMGKTDFYAYQHKHNGEAALMFANPMNHSVKPFITLSQFNDLLIANDLKEVKRMPRAQWLNEYSFYFKKGNAYYEVDNNKGRSLSMNKILTLDKGESLLSSYNDLEKVIIKKDNNLFVKTSKGTKQITNDGGQGIVYGKAVHRFEFGITKGSFWSPDGNSFAFYRKDETMVADYPIIDWSVTPAVSKNIKYPMAGGTSHQVSLGVYNLKDNKVQYLQIEGPKDQYLTSISWSPDEEHIYVGVLNRDQNNLTFNQYNAKDGRFVKTVFEEKHSRYVEPQHSLNFYSNNPNEFIWMSQRDGYMHMYLYQNNQLKKQLTKGEWIVNEILGFRKAANEIVFTGTKDGAMQKNVYSVNVKSGNITSLSSTGGWHYPKLSKSGSLLLEKYKNNSTPNIINVRDVEQNKTLKRLLTAKNPLEDYEMAKVKHIKIKSTLGDTLYGKLIYPIDFDENKKYPAIVYVYNGPHVQLNKDVFPYSGNLWYDYMAQKGYFMFVLDGHGSSNRGFNFESVTHRKLGVIEMEDQLKGVEFLSSRPYIDTNRIGVHGWSFGGYMTTSLMTKYPEVFKCGVAGGPVMDWSMYEIMYTERYMDNPTTNKEGFDLTRLTDKANKIKNKLMIIHGTQDDVVVWQHSMKFIRNAVKENVQVDYAVYPAHPHNVRGMDRIHLMQKITDYFDMYLMPIK